MNKDKEPMVRSQSDLFGRISLAYENLRKSGAANITIGLAEARLQALEANWAKFEFQHDKLLEHWEALSESTYVKTDMPTLAEEAYLTQKGMILDTLRRLRAAERTENPAVGPAPSHPARTTLPRIQLPQFSGLYEDWPSFRDLFHSLIGKDTSAAPVEKLHYLKACLKGEAELLIRNLPTTDENFERAWKSLTDYYENKRLLVRSYLARFTAIQRLRGESSADLRKLYHGVLSTVGSLESIGRPIARGEDLLVHLVVDLLDSRSRREWETTISDTTEPPSYAEPIQFLDRRLHTLESLPPSKTESSPAKPVASSGRPPRVLHARKPESKRGRCTMCHEEHYIMFCDAFGAKTASERRKHVEANQLCFNCLGRHMASEYSSKKTCSSCGERHHSLLHQAGNASEIARSSLSANRSTRAASAVLLATARVRVADKFGVLHAASALVNQGSEISLVAESLAQRLRLTRAPTSTAIVGVGGRSTGARGQVELTLSPLRDGPPLRISAFVLDRLTTTSGGLRADRHSWRHLDNLELANPDFFAADPVELLLGADVCAKILQPGLRRGGRQQPMAQRTTLGWILSGAVGVAPAARTARTYHCSGDDGLHSLVQQFWQQEEVDATAAPLTVAEKEAEEHFVQTHSRDASGRFVVRLPITPPLPDLTGTKFAAARLLGQMERRFTRDEQLRRLYSAFMQEYEDLGHMSPARPGTAMPSECFLPHHGVMRKASSPAKIRVVFNGSSTVASGACLNQHFRVGPNLLPALDDVLLRWRVHRFVLILWRHGDNTTPKEYELNTVTYGLACAPFLAIRSLRQLASNEEALFPQGAAVLRRDVYVDDILTGAPTIEEAMDLQRQLTELCTAGGFPLRKWSANEPRLLDHIPAGHRTHRDQLSWTPQESHATLGLQWHPGIDCFSFSTGAIAVPAFTKRSVLSLTARLFDPLGWLAPTVIWAKIRFQSTWLKGLDWDAPLDSADAQLWSEFADGLPRLEEIRVPRHVLLSAAQSRVELHGFADASERAYAAVIYARTETCNTSISISLISAKTKVAPLKTRACGGFLEPRTRPCTCGPTQPSPWAGSAATRHAGRRTSPTGLPTSRQRCLGPNGTTSLRQRNSPTARREASPPPSWSPTRSNGGGPPWLKEDRTSWPDSRDEELTEQPPEERVRALAALAPATEATEPEELTRFSSLNRLLRVTAWCRRWKHRAAALRAPPATKSRPAMGTLTAAEWDDARLTWIRAVQAEKYSAELATLARGAPLSKNIQLTKLTPFVDSQGILRVGGRIKHVLLVYDERHPMILPSSSHFTRLVIEACHRRTLHGGVQLTLGSIRQQYWIPRGRQLVKEVIRRCIA
ncbi:uncharacterized protein [Polyergus mexicanus]|uniref:uncharacterized protein n=1 Tax=Polyergus mexicanus TaxID=615972 RepID=UPI0038B5BE12